MHSPRLLSVVAFVLVLAGCGAGNETSTSTQPRTTTTQTASSTPATTVAATTTTAPPAPEPAGESTAPSAAESYSAPQPVPTVPIVEPHIVDCQPGLGEVTTYWSDGSVTGYSPYCQSVHDDALAQEVAANTPVCDGVTCRYPSGATMPDPAATPATPSPWVQGQLDWHECIEAGNTEDYCRSTLN